MLSVIVHFNSRYERGLTIYKKIVTTRIRLVLCCIAFGAVLPLPGGTCLFVYLAIDLHFVIAYRVNRNSNPRSTSAEVNVYNHTSFGPVINE